MEKKEMLMAILIGVLLLTTAVQTLTLAGLNSSPITVTKAALSAPASGAPASAGSLAELPSMVGGC